MSLAKALLLALLALYTAATLATQICFPIERNYVDE